MLVELQIENFAIIEKLSLHFGNGLCVITGETGAGKSLLIGALKAILGERIEKDFIREGANEATIWARFIPASCAVEMLSSLGIAADEIVISRKITDSGRSYFWLNGKPVTAELVKKIGNYLVDLHGQHSHQLLLDHSTHLSILDEFAGLQESTNKLAQMLSQYNSLLKELEKIRSQRDDLFNRKRLLEFEIEELTRANLSDPLEEKNLESELERVESAERLLEFSSKIIQTISEEEGSIVERISILRREANDLEKIGEVSQIIDLLDTISAACDEINIIAGQLGKIEYDPNQAQQIRERLTFLGDLQRKYRKNITELMEYLSKIEQEHVELYEFDETEKQMGKKISQMRDEILVLANAISAKRNEAARKLAISVMDQLNTLGMEGAEFSVRLDKVPDNSSPFIVNGERFHLFKSGFEKCEFFFTANPGIKARELRKIASGGELSRIALALKVALPSADKVGCSVFDEIDVGIGGRTAISIAQRLFELSLGKQVIVVTHLHPIARRAKNHIYIEKTISDGKTIVSAKTLSADEIDAELERMMSIE